MEGHKKSWVLVLDPPSQAGWLWREVPWASRSCPYYENTNNSHTGLEVEQMGQCVSRSCDPLGEAALGGQSSWHMGFSWTGRAARSQPLPPPWIPFRDFFICCGMQPC